MFFLRLILIVFLFLVVRRIIRGMSRRSVDGNRTNEASSRPDGKEYGDLTEQDVSDADFEELP